MTRLPAQRWICGLFLSRYTGNDRTTVFVADVQVGAKRDRIGWRSHCVL